MMNKELNSLKDLEGQPWSSWKQIIGSNVPVIGAKKQGETRKSSFDSSCMKLQRADMAIFGLCPKTEKFQLIVCNICGNKYKLPAFAEHIRIRHSSGDSSPASVKCEKSEKHVQKKAKLKKTKAKPKNKEKNEVLGKTVVNINMKVDFMEIVSDRQSLPLESETVPKFKQINLKCNKKNQKNLENNSSKEDSNLSDTCVSKKECISEIRCKNSTDTVWLKAHLKVGNSAIVQDGEVLNMQPIVQLSPLSTTAPSLMTASSVPKCVDNNKKNTITDIPLTVTDRTYNPDIHCGVIEKESAKPCMQPLNCFSHTLALKKAVQGRSKSFDVLVSENKNNHECSSSPELSNSINLDKVNSPVASKMSSLKPLTTSSSTIRTEKVKPQTEPVDENETKNRISKRITSDRPRLSLPVSIKNPTILCQLQNKVIKSKFSLPTESARNESIQDVIKENFVQKQIRNPRLCRGTKENSRIQQPVQKKEGTGNIEPPDILKPPDEKLERFGQWYPGFRRIGGLLYSSPPRGIPFINRKSIILERRTPSLATEENRSSFTEPSFNNISEKSEIIDLCSPTAEKIEFKKFEFEIDSAAKKTVASETSKHILISPHHSKTLSQKQKLLLNQPAINNSNKTVICKRTNNNINGAVPAKIKKQEGLMSIVGPVFSKNNHTLPVMHLEVDNNVYEKQILATSPHIASQNSLGTTLQTGINVIRGGTIRIGPPRIHYVTASGPLPVSIQQVASIQQLQLKPIRIQHKYQLLSPQVITPASGVFYIQKTPTNSSNVNGIEER